jgi:hypothetical protein
MYVSDAQDSFMRTRISGNTCHCSVLICYRPVNSKNRLWCFRYVRLLVTATNITTDWLQSAQENTNICTGLQHENSDHFLIWHKEELVCTGISGSLWSEKGRILRWAGYVA